MRLFCKRGDLVGLFSLPLVLWVHEPSVVYVRASPGTRIRTGIRSFIETFHHIRSLPTVWVFLVAYWLYIDGVGTITRMALDYGLSLGFDTKVLILALLLTQFIAFPAAIVFGRIGERFGAKFGILIGVGVYCMLCV